MKDIARDLGVSVVTVSKVLRNHSDIGPETRDRVLRRMKELNYQPNWAARTLVTGRTYSIGLVVPDLVHPFFAQVAKGITRRIRTKGYSLIISSSEEDPELEHQEVDLLVSRQVDALILASACNGPTSFERCQERNIPCVLIDRRFPGVRANYVGVNDEEVGFVATDHLAEHGCRHIAHIRGPEISTGLGRLAGYRAALAKHGMEYLPEYVLMGQTSDDLGDVTGYEAMRKLLAMNVRPDGVFCYNDPIAVGVMKATLEAGLRVPEDVAVVGAGNVLYSELLRVSLTSVDQNSTTIGDRAARIALKLIESNGKSAPRTVLVPATLIERQSSRHE